MQSVRSIAAPAARILLALTFVTAGLSKIGNYTAMQGFMESAGVPGGLLPLVIVLEIFGGLAIIIGWHTRVTAFLLAGFTLLAGLLFHFDLADPMQSILFWKNVSIAGGFLALVALGAGPFSVDNRLHGHA
jgi:putative oxidoreductase